MAKVVRDQHPVRTSFHGGPVLSPSHLFLYHSCNNYCSGLFWYVLVVKLTTGPLLYPLGFPQQSRNCHKDRDLAGGGWVLAENAMLRAGWWPLVYTFAAFPSIGTCDSRQVWTR